MKRVDYDVVMAELIAMWDEGLNEDSFLTRTDKHHGSVPVIVRGLAAHAADACRATVLLYRAGLASSAVPIIRGVLEDAITAKWLVATPDGWKVIRNASAKQRLGSLEDYLKRVPGDPVLERRAAGLEAVKNQKYGLPLGTTILDRATAVSGTFPLYELYRNASDLSHAGMGVVHLYTQHDPGSPLSASFRTSAHHPGAHDWFAIATWALLQTLIAWDELLSDRPNEARLSELERRIHADAETAQ